MAPVVVFLPITVDNLPHDESLTAAASFLPAHNGIREVLVVVVGAYRGGEAWRYQLLDAWLYAANILYKRATGVGAFKINGSRATPTATAEGG